MQKYRISEALVPMRKEPSHRSEMINELLYGECIFIKESTSDWLEVSCAEYDYIGYIPGATNMIEVEGIGPATFRFVYTAAGIIKPDGVNRFDITRGARISTEETDTGCFKAYEPIQSLEEIVKTAKFYLGNPYRWGGRNPFGIDCSGFTQMVFMLNGMVIPRDARAQVSEGVDIAFIAQAQAGDLAFFQNENGDVTHTGIMISPSEIIHASGSVRIDSIDHHGIYNRELQRYTHLLKSIRRMGAVDLKRVEY